MQYKNTAFISISFNVVLLTLTVFFAVKYFMIEHQLTESRNNVETIKRAQLPSALQALIDGDCEIAHIDITLKDTFDAQSVESRLRKLERITKKSKKTKKVKVKR